ncbi:MAG TPA: hypothetical protein VHG29_10465 [Novosphingobium sp.]|nr:hypothetical protein [Novosphingobium sp.]
MTSSVTLRLEDFIQAVQSQLDNAQAAMALKARNANLPLTFAIKDINLDLRAHVEFSDSEIRIRPAGAGEGEASVFHLVFTTITRPAIEENAQAFSEEPDDESLDDIEELSHEDRKRLEWAGVRTVRQLQQADQGNRARAIGRATNLSADRLRKVLDSVSAPLVQRVEPVPARPGDNPDDPQLVRVIGRNLVRQGLFPQVRIGNRPVSILKSSADELLIAPGDGQWAGELSVEPTPQRATAMSFDLSAFAPVPVSVEPPAATIAPAPLAPVTQLQ